jgi:hypothetical protein
MKTRILFFKRWATFAVALCICSAAFAQTHIPGGTYTAADFRALFTDLTATGSYVLDGDITLTGNWTPLGDFSGTLDGNEHVIFNMTIDMNQNGTAFFQRIKGDAVVKNLGFENASVTNRTESRTAIVAGFLEGNAVIENCYIANSTILGRWCVGSFVGRATSITDGGTAAIRNCYSSATIYHASENNNGRGMTGGIIGNIYDGDKMTVENCYFAGIIQKVFRATESTPGEGNIAGIIGWIGKDGAQTISNYIVRNNVNLAPYLLSNQGKHRISSTRSDDVAVNDPTPGPNYSLSTTVVSTADDWGNMSAIITTGTLTNKDGENIPGGDANAKTQAFYESLNWDFAEGTGIWEVETGDSYPKFQWADDTRPHFVVAPTTIPSVQASAPVDLSKYIFSGRGLPLTFSSVNAKVSVIGSTVSFASDAVVTNPELVIVQVQEGDLSPKKDLQITLLPNVIHITDQAGLAAIGSALSANYVLDNDITLTGNWMPLGTFTGMLDGQNYVIYNLNPVEQDMMAFFTRINGGTVKNLGFENASVIDATHSRVAVLAGFVNGNALIENCYVANSTISGRWCVGSFAGRADGAATIRNCYSSASLTTPDFSGGAGHTGGIIGNIFENGVTVENCYFSGVIQRIAGNNAEGQVAGIVGWNGKGGTDQQNVTSTIQNNVNLAPYLLSNYAKNRIASSSKGLPGGEPTPGPNYSLSTTVVSSAGGWENTTDIIATGTATNKDGADITAMEAKTQTFYSGLGWDFTAGTGIWEMSAGYPVFPWEKSVAHFVTPNAEVNLAGGATLDLTKYIFSGRGLALTFETADEDIDVTSGGVVSYVKSVTDTKSATVTVKETGYTETTSITVNVATHTVTGVASGKIADKRVIDASYFDLTGRPVLKAAAKGLLLRKSVYEDGATSYDKVYVK